MSGHERKPRPNTEYMHGCIESVIEAGGGDGTTPRQYAIVEAVRRQMTIDMLGGDLRAIQSNDELSLVGLRNYCRNYLSKRDMTLDGKTLRRLVATVKVDDGEMMKQLQFPWFMSEEELVAAITRTRAQLDGREYTLKKLEDFLRLLRLFKHAQNPYEAYHLAKDSGIDLQAVGIDLQDSDFDPSAGLVAP